MTHFLIFLVVAYIVLYGPSRLRKVKNRTETTTDQDITNKSNSLNTYIMKLIGGPANGYVEKVVEPERPLFYVATYPPEMDEATGMPPEENIVGHMHDKLYVRPNYAYYRFVMDDEYIYVRDLEEREVQTIAITGEQPEVKPGNLNAEDN
jgi:hypothetical protein